MESEVLKKNAARFYREKLAESSERHRKIGDSVYLLEPQLKEGAGRAARHPHRDVAGEGEVQGERASASWCVKGVISERERAEIEASQDFLLRVRNALHFLTGSPPGPADVRAPGPHRRRRSGSATTATTGRRAPS